MTVCVRIAYTEGMKKRERQIPVQTNTPTIEEIVRRQREYFNRGETHSVSARILLLKQLYDSIKCHEQEILHALAADLGKSSMEAFMTEIGITLKELNHTIKHLPKWTKPQRKATWLANFHAKSMLISEPYGVTLVMSPWNYPFMLCMVPMIGAVAAGNCCVVKPSAYAPATSAVVSKVIEAACPSEWVTVVEGGRSENNALLDMRFDYIFFTGGPKVGREVMAKAAKHLTPVTLELGGKSPVIIDDSADLKLAARRIAFGKLVNCGQTCVAPDYVLIDQRVEPKFVEYLVEAIEQFYGTDPISSPDYGCIINEKHYHRLLNLIDVRKTHYGGVTDPARLKIAPTIMRDVNGEDAVMQEEIFGPILPIIPVENMVEAEDFVLAREKPLALYVFTKRKVVEDRFLNYVSFGGGCVNDTLMHIASTDLPFGGVGNSGMGSYHGYKSFETFSHQKSVLKKYNWIDLPLRYPPYKSKLLEQVIRLVLR